ncbi:MAG: hypothetical protein GY773_15445, partial [Actinomycetia bacterium]|nr:hypothetical protein [Actinomycetes bacterium]
LRYYDRPPNMAGWVWRITDTNHIPKRDSPLETLYNTRAAPVEAGREAPHEIYSTMMLGVDDPTHWHTINPEPPEPHTRGDRTAMDDLVWRPDRSEPGGY